MKEFSVDVTNDWTSLDVFEWFDVEVDCKFALFACFASGKSVAVGSVLVVGETHAVVVVMCVYEFCIFSFPSFLLPRVAARRRW